MLHFKRQQRFSPLECCHLRPDERRPETVRHRCIGKAPHYIIPVIRVAPAATEPWLGATRTVPIVHFIKALSEAAFRHDHLNAVREVALTGSRAAFVAGHWRTPWVRREAIASAIIQHIQRRELFEIKAGPDGVCT